MKRKSIALAMAAALVMGTLAGCGGTEQTPSSEVSKPSKTESSAQQSSASSEAEVEKQETVNISVVVVGTNDQAAQEQVINACNAYSEEKIGVTISFAGFGWGEFDDTASRMLAAKDDVDVIFHQGNLTWASGGALMELSDILPQYPNIVNVMPQWVWDSVMVDGELYFIPNYKETGTGMTLCTPVELADKVKAQFDIDFNDIEMNSIFDAKNLEPYLQACKDLGVTYSFATGFDVYSWLAGTDPTYERAGVIPFVINKETFEVTTFYEIPEFKEYLALMQDWNEKGFWLEEQVMSDYDWNAVANSADFAVMGWTTVPNNEDAFFARHKFNAYMKEVVPPIVNSASNLGATWSLTAYTEKVDACMKWIELLQTDKAYADLFIFGEEGVQYTREADGRITKIPKSGWSNDVWKSTNTWNASILSTESLDKYQQYTDFNAAAITSPLLGFRPDFTNVNTEKAAVTAIDTEVKAMFGKGFYGEKELEDTIARLKAAGSDKVCAELQAQLDEWLKTK